MAKMRNVSFAASVTRFRMARIGPAWPAMPVSSFTSRSMVWTTDSCGSTYPDGIVQRPFDGPYVLRTTRSFPSRTRKAPAPTVIGSVATLWVMTRSGARTRWLYPRSRSSDDSVRHGTEGHVHPAALPQADLAARELRRVPRRPVARLRREQGRPVVRLPPGPSDEEGSDPPGVRAVRPESGVRSEEHTSELQSRPHLVCRLLLEKKKK